MLINHNEKMVETSSNLRGGVLMSKNGEILVTAEKFNEIITNYVNEFTSHGVKSFVYAVTIKPYGRPAVTEFYRATPSQIKNNPMKFYSYNANGRKQLQIVYRTDKSQRDWISKNCQKIEEIELEKLLNIEEINCGYKAEVALYGKSQHKRTYSDGKSRTVTGKKENSQLKADIITFGENGVNNGRSRSNAIYTFK